MVRFWLYLDWGIQEYKSFSSISKIAYIFLGGKTGTGTIIVNLLDENDNYPVIVPKEYTICRDRKPICLTAVDADIDPHTVPFTFSIPERETQNWRLTENDGKYSFLKSESFTIDLIRLK